jgi:hypothetical protein
MGRSGARVRTLPSTLTTAGAEPARRTGFLAAIALLVGLGLVAQFRSYIGADTGFLLDEAARALDGARLYVDLVDMNPPLIVLLNMGAVLLARLLGIPGILAYRLGCTATLLAVLLLATWLLRRLLPDELRLQRAIILLLAFALFALPGQDFGEREHLLVALLIPYLLVAAARATRRQISPATAALVGLLAAGAFALKPQFVLLWPAVEVSLRLTRRVKWGRILPETTAIAAFLALYAAAILLWAPEYLRLVSLLAGPYARFLYVPFWELLVTGPGALLTVFALLASVALRRHARHQELLGVVSLGALACLVAGAAQQKGFGYHFYPALALATVVLGIIACDGRESPRNGVAGLFRVLAVSLLATVIVVVGVRTAATAWRPPLDLEQEHMERLLPIVRAHAAGGSVYVMSHNISSAYPLINYAGARSASRFAQLWILAAAYMEQLKRSHPLRYHAPSEMSPSERYLNQAVLEDLRDRRPGVLVILQHARDLPTNGFRRLDYVGYFSRDSRIAVLLDRYQLVADLGDFRVYERLADGAARTSPAPGITPGAHDVVPVRRGAGLPVRIGNSGFLLAVLVFIIGATVAGLAEKSRAASLARAEIGMSSRR